MKYTIDLLNKAYYDYFNDQTNGIFQDQRFGQYFYNEYDLEVDNSFYLEDDQVVYEMLYKYIWRLEMNCNKLNTHKILTALDKFLLTAGLPVVLFVSFAILYVVLDKIVN